MITAGDVMDGAAALLNDSAKSVFTYAAQTPHLNVAIDELKELMEQSNVPASNDVSSILVVNTTMTDIGGSTGPPLPVGLIEIQTMWERTYQSSEDFQLMSRVEFLPPYEVLLSSLVYWAWVGQVVKFIGSTSDREIRINYVKDVIPKIVSETQQIETINAKSYLTYRTAALCAQFIGENKTRADDLNGFAQAALDRFLGINAKGRQSFSSRRRPFMAGYKVRGGI